LRALAAGVEAFRRNRSLPERLRGEYTRAVEALRLLPHLTAVSGQWLLLFGGRHPALPDDPHLTRVVGRLGKHVDDVSRDLGGAHGTAARRVT
jgi:hypothetical protein